MSDSVQPHRQQPTRFLCPWDSPGNNTGMGCHFLLQCMKVKSESEVAQSCPTLHDPMDCSLPGSSAHGIFPGKSTGVGCHCLLHHILITIYLSIPWTLSCFDVLASVNSASLNSGVHVSFQIVVLSTYMPRNGIAE